MNDRELDRLLHDAKVPEGPGAETLSRIAHSVAGSMRPVRPLPPMWLLAARLVFVYAVVAVAAAASLGFPGVRHMDTAARAGVFSVLAILVLVAAPELVRTIIPGARRRFSSGTLLGIAAVAIAAVLFLFFRDFHTTHFWRAGIVCLALGTGTGIFAALLARVALRRGFATDARTTGLVSGTLAGLAGVTMLELHCPNFQTAHLLVWHVGVLLLSSGLGAMIGWRSQSDATQ
ncbi:DUF1109 domain-containing protein [Occallatibacter riparius]|uniref:DUF1109 domain-containing protein n=1 Tax=Occallatibacter riparius TaxID=1002689 RepID=A0A9J7BSA4_9BACT|nr:DUF1109 domain-containing protein [Occallatibacter riparius]UWZ85544.1 DUF1109 domain-containing protein [Occallatibacter riparius]